jgi:propane monooxygenase reductase subunit
MAQVKVMPFERTIECEEGQAILQAALTQGYYLRYGCKHGGCGTCKAMLVDGDVVDSSSSFALPGSERAKGYILVCSSRPTEDCVLDISSMELTEDEFLAGDKVEVFETTLVRRELLTPTICGLTLRLAEPSSIKFIAGQYVNVEIPDTTVVRSFSFANTPSSDGEIELIVRLIPDGQFGRYLSTRGEVGELVRVFGPMGSLKMRPSYRKLVMVAGGTGLAPILSMLGDLAEKGTDREIVCFVGARTCSELYFLARLEALRATLPGLEIIPVAEQPENGWRGERGRVTGAIPRSRSSLKGYDAYICGPGPMVDAARTAVVDLGVREKNVYYDAFVPTGE